MAIRPVLFSLLATLLLASCSPETSEFSALPAADVAVSRVEGGKADEAFAYNHALSMSMASKNVEPRFARARDRCLNDTSLGCTLISANISSGGPTDYDIAHARLDVMLPGENLDQFGAALTEPVPGEKEAEAKVVSRSTTAQNVQQEAGDLEQQVTQLTDYRDRLTELARRPNLAAAELIQIAGELSKTQAALDQLLSRRQGVSERVNKHRLSVMLSGNTAEDPLRPISRVLAGASHLFIDSVADALRFAIRIIPWLPIVLAGVLVVPWLWRRIRRTKAP